MALQGEIERVANERAATPEEARRANADLRTTMRQHDNYFADIEAHQRGSSSTLSSMMQQVSAGLGVALGAILLNLSQSARHANHLAILLAPMNAATVSINSVFNGRSASL